MMGRAERPNSTSWRFWLAVLAAAVGGAGAGAIIGPLIQRPHPVAVNPALSGKGGVNARIDAVDAAMMYAERKAETAYRRLTTLEEWVRMIVACVRHSCAPEAREVALRQAEQAMDDLDATVDRFVHPYAGLSRPATDERGNSGDEAGERF